MLPANGGIWAYIYIYIYIPPTLWAKGSLEKFSIEISSSPILLPDLRSGGLGSVVFTKPYKTLSESLQKRNVGAPFPLVFLLFLTLVGRFLGLGENDKPFCFLFSSLPAAGHRQERLLLSKQPHRRTYPRQKQFCLILFWSSVV